MKPFIAPKASVRLMQMRLTGPMGAAAINPIRMPANMRTIRFTQQRPQCGGRNGLLGSGLSFWRFSSG
jgi:hypothetical protein